MRFLYAVINVLLLGAIVWLLFGKSLKAMFAARREKINRDLDEAAAPLPELEALPEESPAEISAPAAVEEDSLEVELKAIELQLQREKEAMHTEMLLQTRSRLIQKTMDKARSYMTTDKFHAMLRAQEDSVADKIISCIRLTPGDMNYIAKKGVLYVTLMSAEPLKAETVEKMRAATDDLLSSVGSRTSFLIKDSETDLIGGFRLRIGDTVYDYSVKGRLYRLQEALNGMPLKGTSAGSMVSAMERAVKKVDIEVDIFQLGRVLTVSDGICWMDGLADIMFGELVEFTEADRPMYGMVMDVQPDKIGCMIFGRYEHVDAYSRVRRMGRMANAAVGEELLGRVIDPIGNPIDGKGRILSSETREIEWPAPAIYDRQPVDTPLETGIKAIDALVPIGRGQRELIIGDRQTGKTSLIADTIINQKGKGVYCIYVAIGQKETTVASLVSKLEEHGAMEYTAIVCASASDSASLQYIAPFVGCAMGEYFMYKGKDALIIYDDLSKHAVAYRELSLLLHRPSGREAYPGDIFYLHSRLLERAARLSADLGGGSLTALPIIETQAGDISAYIPTNVISITDGQIFLETDLFNAGQRPAVNVGLSVSRVGGAAQTKLMKQVSANLRTSLAQYREYAAFTQFGSDIDEATKKTLDSGERMMALLRQNRFEPMPTWQQALLIFAVSKGAADGLPTEAMASFEQQFTGYMQAAHPDICARLMTGAKMDRELMDRIASAAADFRQAAANG